MKRRTACWLFIMCMLSAGSVVSAESGKHIYDSYRQTVKNMETSYSSMTMILRVVRAGMYTETTVYKKGNKTRVDSEIKKSPNPMLGKPGQKNIMIDDGIQTTVFTVMMGKMVSPSEQEIEGADQPDKIRLIGLETISGFKCHKLKVNYPLGEVRTLWISASDSVLVQEADPEGTIVTYSDFNKVGEFQLPYLTEEHRKGRLESSSTIISVRIDDELPDSLFDPLQVKGFKTSQHGIQGSKIKTGNTDESMTILEMGAEIQHLYQNGEVEKAKALEKKMQEMMGQ